MEHLQKSLDKNKNCLYIITLIFNKILFDDIDKPLYENNSSKKAKKDFLKVNEEFNEQVKLNKENEDLGINNEYLLEKIDSILKIDNVSIKVLIIYFIVEFPKFMTITDYILIRNKKNYDILLPYSFNDFTNFTFDNQQDYKVKMYFYIYFNDIFDIELQNGYITNKEYQNQLDYYRNKGFKY